jgi:predicted acylesterase/phospholipase RssA
MTTSPTPPQGLPPEVAELQHADYTQASAPCDVVMKGGVTSGVVYPTAICRLAQSFRFHSIGGTSAGALAAALAAAAEFQRLTAGTSAGFQRLAEVSQYLGTGSNLRDLFQPSADTQALFELGMGFIEKGPNGGLLGKVARPYLPVLAVTLLVAIAVAVAVVRGFGDWLGAVLLVVVIAILAGAWAAARAARALWSAVQRIPDNNFGLCNGLDAPAGAPVPLTPWLADRIDYVAGRRNTPAQAASSNFPPLTFGDLYRAVAPPADSYPGGSPVLDALNAAGRRAVNLQMVTTDVTAGRPYRLPFDDPVTAFYYDPGELRRFFPQRVLDRMAGPTLVANVPTTANGDEPTPVTLMPFPSGEDLPVVVAARMSMSFPFLFSAVPLYAADRDAVATWLNDPSSPQPMFRKTWFSDGGLSSNIPIHFFDGPIPRWPTFAINLRGFPQTKCGFRKRLPPDPSDRDKVFPATAFDPDVELFDWTGSRRLFQFVNSLLDAMRNWNDNTLMQLPGYRERTMEIAMNSDEGGLNLTMPPAVVTSIMTRGVYAGEAFVNGFALPDPAQSTGWNEHRRTRLHSSLLMQEEWMRRFSLTWQRPPYATLIPDPTAVAFAQQLAAAPGAIPAGMTLTHEPWPAAEMRARPRV